MEQRDKFFKCKEHLQLAAQSINIQAYKLALMNLDEIIRLGYEEPVFMSDVYIHKAICYEGLEQIELAEENYLLANRCNQDSPFLLSSWGIFYFNTDNYKRAIEIFKLGIELGHTRAHNWYMLAHSYFSRALTNLQIGILERHKYVQDMHEAYISIKEAIEQEPDDRDTNYLAGRISNRRAIIYESMTGKKEYTEAHYFLQKAANMGDKDARTLLMQLPQ